MPGAMHAGGLGPSEWVRPFTAGARPGYSFSYTAQ